MIPALARAAQAASAPVTDWMPRILLTLAVLAIIGLGVWGMRRGWRARAARQSDVPVPPGPPAWFDSGMPPGVPGTYVATTRSGDLLDRIVVHGLGHRGRAELHIGADGVLIDRVGEVPVWIPRESLTDVRLGSGQAQKAYEAGGLILVTWRLGEHLLDTGFRADDPEAHLAAATELSALVTPAGGPR